MGSTAGTSFFIKNKHGAWSFIFFSKTNKFKIVPGDQDAPEHIQRPQHAHPWGVQQVPFLFIKS